MTTDFTFINTIENVGEHCFSCCNYFLYFIIFLCLPSPCLDVVILENVLNVFGSHTQKKLKSDRPSLEKSG